MLSKYTIKYVLLLIGFQALYSNAAFSTETHYGIGARLSAYNSALYFPITTANYIFEPSISFNLSEEKQVEGIYRNNKTIFMNFGLYKKSILTKNSVLYYGPRVGYQEYSYRRGYTTDVSTTNGNGFDIGAVVGVEYFQSTNFSIGIDLGISLALDKRNETNSNETSGLRAVSTANIILRYHFK